MICFILKQQALTNDLESSMFKVNRQGHKQKNETIGILDHENMGIAFGIIVLSALDSVLWPIL